MGLLAQSVIQKNLGPGTPKLSEFQGKNCFVDRTTQKGTQIQPNPNHFQFQKLHFWNI